MTNAYKDIRHCIHCGAKGFDSFDAVLKHVKENHMVIGTG